MAFVEGEFIVSLCRLLMYSVEALPTHYIDTNTKPTDSGYLIFQMMLGMLPSYPQQVLARCQPYETFHGDENTKFVF